MIFSGHTSRNDVCCIQLVRQRILWKRPKSQESRLVCHVGDHPSSAGLNTVHSIELNHITLNTLKSTEKSSKRIEESIQKVLKSIEKY